MHKGIRTIACKFQTAACANSANVLPICVRKWDIIYLIILLYKSFFPFAVTVVAMEWRFSIFFLRIFIISFFLYLLAHSGVFCVRLIFSFSFRFSRKCMDFNQTVYNYGDHIISEKIKDIIKF